MYTDRAHAGRELAAALAELPVVQSARADGRAIVVLGIPRGGLPVGAEVASALGAELDVVVVRKLRTPWQHELGYGAVGPDGTPVLDSHLVERLGLGHDVVAEEVADRHAEVQRRLTVFRQVRPAVEVAGSLAIVVDDGIATGSTARMACAWARQAGASRVVLAAPVGPPDAEERLADAADEILILSQPAGFAAVGQVYRDFAQLEDDDAVEALRRAAAAR